MKKILIGCVMLVVCFTSYSQCGQQFYSFDNAIENVESGNFDIIRRLPYGKSSWILSATYYGCTADVGFMIFRTDKSKTYIHQDLPYKVWKAFVSAQSSGDYYNSYIKGRYRLRL